MKPIEFKTGDDGKLVDWEKLRAEARATDALWHMCESRAKMYKMTEVEGLQLLAASLLRAKQYAEGVIYDYVRKGPPPVMVKEERKT